jgi:hypothetical protein
MQSQACCIYVQFFLRRYNAMQSMKIGRRFRGACHLNFQSGVPPKRQLIFTKSQSSAHCADVCVSGPEDRRQDEGSSGAPPRRTGKALGPTGARAPQCSVCHVQLNVKGRCAGARAGTALGPSRGMYSFRTEHHRVPTLVTRYRLVRSHPQGRRSQQVPPEH